MNVKFLTGSQNGYDQMAAHDSGTFYFTGENVYLGDILLSNDNELTEILTEISNNTAAIAALENEIGNLEDLNTTSKNDIVSAINEVFLAIGTGGTAAVISIEESSSNDYAKVYTISQGGSVVGTINIPKDLVVESGEVEVNPQGQPDGTYIVLTLANTDNQKIYVNVEDLVDIYTAASNATQVQLAVNGTEISATLVAGGVGTTELADGAIATAKIADGNVTTVKLATAVQESLGKADSAVQSITTGMLNGTIMVDGTSISVAGLGSAAYKESTDFDTSGAAASAEESAKTYADSLLIWEEY